MLIEWIDRGISRPGSRRYLWQIRVLACVAVIAVAVLPLPGSAWNIPGHMISATIAYQILQQENPQTIEKVKVVMEKHPWYANQWQARLQDGPVPIVALRCSCRQSKAKSELLKTLSTLQTEIYPLDRILREDGY